MAFPTISDITKTDLNAGGATHNVNIADSPASPSSGDLLLIIGSVDSDNNTAIRSGPSGFTEIYTDDVNGNHVIGTCWAKVSDGTEAGTTETFVYEEASSPFDNKAQIAYYYSLLIPSSSWFGALSGIEVDSGNDQSGTITDPDPPPLTTSWGAEDTLWIVVMHSDNSAEATVTGYPTNYTSNQNFDKTSSSGGAGISIATRNLNTASEENPAAFTLSVADQSLGKTIAIRPASTTSSSSVIIRRTRGF